MLAALTGARMLFNYFRIGGVNGDLNHEFMSRLGDWMSRAGKQVEANAASAQRERDLRPADARRGRDGPRDGPPLRGHGREPARLGRAVRRPPGPPLQRLPRARLQHPDAPGGRLPGPLPDPGRRDPRVDQDHRPVPPQHARRPDHGQAAAPDPAAAGARLGSSRGTARDARRLRRSATARTSRSASGSTTRASSTSSRAPSCCPATSWPTRWPSSPRSTRSWAGSTSEGRPTSLADEPPGPAAGTPVDPERMALIVFHDAAIGGAVTTVLAIVWLGPPLTDFLGANLPLVRFVVAAITILLLTVPTAFVLIYLELKVIARMNLRVGPNRIGPLGAAMSVIHGLKVLSKEDFAPTGADLTVFTLAPVVTYLASVMTLLVIPFAPGLYRPGPQHRPAVLLRHGRPDRRRPADGRLVELQQVLAAGRPALGGADHQLRDPAHALGRGRHPAGRNDEPEQHRPGSIGLRPGLVRLQAAAGLGSSSSSPPPPRPTALPST